MDRCVLVAALALAATACGSGPVIGSDDIANFPDASRDATLPRDAGLDADGALDAPLDAVDDSTKYVGGPFLCDQCVCDGTVDMCLRSGGGAQPMPLDDAGFGDASTCPTDAGPSSLSADADRLSAQTFVRVHPAAPPAAGLLVHRRPERQRLRRGLHLSLSALSRREDRGRARR